MRGAQDGLGAYVLAGLAVLALLVGGVFAWLASATLSSAIAVHGVLAPAGSRHVVQHQTGGTVAEILVAEGARVQAGAVLLRLQAEAAQEELAALRHLLFDLGAKKARLRALLEAPEGASLAFAPSQTPAQAEIVAQERDIYRAMRAAEVSALHQHKARLAQIDQLLTGIDAQIGALFAQRALLDAGLADQHALLERGLTSAQQVRALERERAALQGQLGEALAERARTEASRSELIEAEALGQAQRRAALLEERRAVEHQVMRSQMALRQSAAQIEEAEIVAPVGGIVFGLGPIAVASVVTPAQPIMSLIPSDVAQQAALRVAARDIDEVKLGQDVTLMLTALGQGAPPELAGRVMRISPDAHRDDHTGQPYFEVDVAFVAEDATPELAETSLKVGTPVDAFIKTGTHSPLTYLARPLATYLAQAFRER